MSDSDTVLEPAPLGDRILVLVLEMDDKIGSIAIPDMVRARGGSDMVWEAKVLAVGDGWSAALGRVISCPVQVGDVVLLPKMAGVAWGSMGTSGGMQIVQFEDVIAKVVEREKTSDEKAADAREEKAGESLARLRSLLVKP
jgi:co-chaperonin GroES (HSP10)